MATNYPSSLDDSTSLPYPTATDNTNSPSLAGGQDNQNDAVIAVETLVGTNSSQTTPTAQYNVLQATSASASEWAKLTSNNVSSATGSGSFVFATSPTITGATLTTPTINNPTLNTDSVIGYTTSNDGTVFGMSVTGGVLASAALAGSVDSAALATGIEVANKEKNPYKFRVYRNSSYTTVAATSTITPYDTVDFDTGSNFSTSTYKFTVPITGFYFFSCAVVLSSDSSNTRMFTTIESANAGELARSSDYNATTGGYYAASVSTFAKLTAADTVYVNYYTQAALSVITGSATNFTGFLVSET